MAVDRTMILQREDRFRDFLPVGIGQHNLKVVQGGTQDATNDVLQNPLSLATQIGIMSGSHSKG
jgi:hypothetical protein